MKIYQVDAFTNEIFKGNPAGVCILPSNTTVNNILLQNIAMEMNLSETAFLIKEKSEYNLRWFTPEVEVDFCGHATLASAHILWEIGLENIENELIFNTKSGKLFAKKIKNKIELNFPIFEVNEVQSDDRINVSLGINPIFIGTDNKRYLIEIENYEDLLEINPDFNHLKDIGKTVFMVTCKSENPKYDFYSRFFAPSVGINEDPVTGSAHSYLVPYWANKLKKRILNSYQASKRGGELECELTDNKRVLLRGQATTVFEIEMKHNIA
jgi:PhzF family phenazine biosynthesis protein